MDEDGLPSWFRMASENPVLRAALEAVFSNPQVAERLRAAYAAGGPGHFSTHVGDWSMVGAVPQLEAPSKGAVGATLVGRQDPLQLVGIAIDVDRIHESVQQDSAKAAGLVREALVHELAHLEPLLRTRDHKAMTGDPAPNHFAQMHPVIRAENELRAMLGLPARTRYSLLD